MKRFMILCACIIAAALAASCSHSVKYTELKKVSPGKKSPDKIEVYEIGDPIRTGYEVIGSVWLGETGFSHSCGYSDALYLARQKAREVGADAVQIIQVIKPDFISTCYRVEVNLLELHDTATTGARK